MFLVGILSWWYTSGWIGRIKMLRSRLLSSIDFFSIGLLIRTLFSPFRQISAVGTNGPIGMQIRSFVDRTISRFVGAFVRLMMIFIGSIAVIVQIVFGVVMLIIWLIIPLLPAAGVILTVLDWSVW